LAGLHDFPCAGIDRVVAAVVTDQHGHARLGLRIHQRLGLRRGIGHRFFYQYRHAALQAVQRHGHVQCIGCGNDRPLQRHGIQQGAVVGKPAYTQALGQGQVAAALNAVHMRAAYAACAKHGKLGFLHGQIAEGFKGGMLFDA
jgi:hypothetical protein